MAFDGKTALKILERIGNANRKGEFYLTDAVKIARDMKLKAVALEVTEDEVSGINTKAQLAATEATMQQRLRQAALEAGVTLRRARDGSSRGGHQARPGRHGRALCGVRPRCHGGGGRDHPLVLASGGRPCRQERHRRPLCAAAARRKARRECAHRQFRRGQGGADRGRRQGQSPDRISATPGSARAPTSAPAPSPATTTARPSIAPTSARAPSSARIRRWWRRSRSATAPMSDRAR